MNRSRGILNCCGLAFVALVLSIALAVSAKADSFPPRPGPTFSLTDHNDQPISDQTLRGKVWVADFFFVNCGGPCPAMTQRMASLAKRVTDPDARFVCFSVDPLRDTPAVMREYAKERGVTDPRIHFVTAPSTAEVQRIASHMLVAVGEARPGQQILHSERFMILDGQGQLRASFNAMAEGGPEAIEAEVNTILLGGTKKKHPLIDTLPVVNASLNAAAAILLCVGLGFIVSGKQTAHAVTMILALVTSATFLACYLTLHWLKSQSGSPLTKFPESSWRPVYLTILTSHTILAIVVLPMIITTVIFAWKRNWVSHRKLAKPTFWIWLYVSVTGVVVYWMLYQLAPRLVQTAQV